MSSKLPKKKYRETLDKQSSARYDEKLKLIAETDPYEINKSDMSGDMKCLPLPENERHSIKALGNC